MTDIKKDFVVGVTKDYDMFRFLEGNRSPNTRMINKLEKSIKDHGIQVPIVVNPDKQIVDGQHRFWALRKLDYRVPYIVSNAWQSDTDTMEINNTGTKWNAWSFAENARANGAIQVGEAMKIAEKWEKETNRKLRRITSLELLMEGRSHAGLRTKLRNRTYQLDREKGFQVYETLNEMSQHDMKASPYSARITRAMKIMNYDYNDLNEEVIAIMCERNYIKNFNKENDQLEYLIDCYEEALEVWNMIRKKKGKIKN